MYEWINKWLSKAAIFCHYFLCIALGNQNIGSSPIDLFDCQFRGQGGFSDLHFTRLCFFFLSQVALMPILYLVGIVKRLRKHRIVSLGVLSCQWHMPVAFVCCIQSRTSILS